MHWTKVTDCEATRYPGHRGERLMVLYQPKGAAREYCEWAANLYRGCAHGCTYCYAPAVLREDRETFRRVRPRPGVLDHLRHDLAREQGAHDVLLCFTCDPYPPEAVEQGTTRRAIGMLGRAGHRPIILSKAGGAPAERDFDLLAQFSGQFGATLTFPDAERSRLWEPGAALPAERMETLRRAHAQGIPTWVSLEPVLDPEASLDLIGLTKTYVDTYKVGRWNHDTRANAIDWSDFGHRAETLLKKLGKTYLIKAGLRKEMR